MGGAGESAPGPAAKTTLRLQPATKHTPAANTSADLEARMNKPLGTKSLQLLDHREWEKVSGRNYCPAALSILLATLTPLSPFTYLAMPRYSDSAMRWRFSQAPRGCA